MLTGLKLIKLKEGCSQAGLLTHVICTLQVPSPIPGLSVSCRTISNLVTDLA